MKATHKKTNLAAVLAALLLLASGCAAPAAAPAADASYPTDSVWYAPAAEAPAAEVPSYYDSGANVAPEAPHNTEEYSAITENGFRTVATSPLSTFSADVDTASYANIRRMIESGLRPEADAVRIEEMLNYFPYDYPAATGEEPFSVTTELSDCPWNRDAKLLLIGLQADKIHMERQPASNLVFLLDVSGSMNQSNKLPLMKRAFILLAEQLRPEDRVSIVTYASSDRVVLSGATGDEKDDIMRAIENLTAGGSTAGSAGIKTAYMLAEEYFVPGGNNRIILGTDGDLNVGGT
ncbi:MAG: von Willebrand factor type A domain-containing protein, partial [Eubacteriales bacterium]|nr:von Willebrand factor type A domain-containing protein [Eubacteriales bacterium]